MGWFSPVKGSYPSLAQIDKTLPVKGDNVATIKRGTIVALKSDSENADGVFDVAAATDTLLYVALQDYSDPTAGFAGNIEFSKSGNFTATSRPAITALALSMEGEYETSVFDTTKSYAIGDALYVADGVLTTTSASGATLVGYVTRGKTERWINNAIAVSGDANNDPRLAVRTGATMNVLRFRTAK